MLKPMLVFCLVLQTVIFSGCRDDSKSEKSPESSAPVPVDYDSHVHLDCTENSTRYTVFLYSGMIIDQLMATIDRSCSDVFPKIEFICESAADTFVLYPSFEGKINRDGHLGQYKEKTDCEGYARALKRKR